MKRLVFLVVSAVMAFTMCVGQSSYKVTFVNKYKGNGNFKWEKLYLFSLKDKEVIDSAVNKSNKYVFKGVVSQPQLASICVSKDGRQVLFAFVLDNEPLTLELEKGLTVKGSKLNSQLKEITDKINSEGKILRDLQQYANKIAQENNGVLPDSTGKRLDKEWDLHGKAQMSCLKKGIMDNKENVVSEYFILNYYDVLPYSFLDSVFVNYKFKDDNLMKHALKRLHSEGLRQEGHPFTDFTMQGVDGKDVKLSDYAGKGKYLLIDFWASWCGPCKAFIPTLKELYKDYHSKGLDILGVSFDNNKEAWIKCIKEKDLPWHQMSDLKGWDSIASNLYNIKAIPFTLLLSPDGKIVAVNLPHEELVAKIKEIFKSK